MKFTGNHFGLLFLTSAEMEPADFLEEMKFMVKFTSIFAPWEETLASITIPDADELNSLTKTTDMCNIVVKNFKGNFAERS